MICTTWSKAMCASRRVSDGRLDMRVPLNWLADYADLPADTDPHALAAEFAGVGLEEEDFFGPEVTGPLVVGRVLDLVKEEHANGKTISWCRVDVGPQ